LKERKRKRKWWRKRKRWYHEQDVKGNLKRRERGIEKDVEKRSGRSRTMKEQEEGREM
jgi:hypothetical protein